MKRSKLENLKNAFNEAYSVGDSIEVLITINGAETFIDKIKHKATIMGGHTVVTWLEKKGSYDISFVRGKAKLNTQH